MDDPRDRSAGAYGEEPQWLVDHFGGSLDGAWGQIGATPQMLAAVQAPMVWDIRQGTLAGDSQARWATRPVRVQAWGEWITKVTDAGDVFESADALREVDGLVIAQPVPTEWPCPACGEHHPADQGRFDRRSLSWQPCWEMTGALWALVKDRDTPHQAKAWARDSLGLEDRYAPREVPA